MNIANKQSLIGHHGRREAKIPRGNFRQQRFWKTTKTELVGLEATDITFWKYE